MSNPRIARSATDTAGKQQVRTFLAECTVRDRDETDLFPVADLYGMYILWCEQAGIMHRAVQTFTALVRAEGIESGTSRRERVFKGVAGTGVIAIQYILETDKVLSPNSTLEMLS